MDFPGASPFLTITDLVDWIPMCCSVCRPIFIKDVRLVVGAEFGVVVLPRRHGCAPSGDAPHRLPHRLSHGNAFVCLYMDSGAVPFMEAVVDWPHLLWRCHLWCHVASYRPPTVRSRQELSYIQITAQSA